MYLYTVYGIKIASEIECPELLEHRSGHPDLLLKINEISETLPGSQRVAKRWQVSQSSFQYNLENVARYRFVSPGQILISPAKNAGMEEVRLYLLGTILGAYLHYTKRPPLHAGAVVHQSQAIAIAGQSGAGKSTLVTQLQHRGHQVLSDDVAVITKNESGGFSVHPGFPRTKLWRDTLAHLQIDPTELIRDSSRNDKFHLKVREEFYKQPVPLKSLIFLETCSDTTFTIEQLKPHSAVSYLIRDTYRPSMVKRFGNQTGHLKQCADIAAIVPCYSLRRPKNFSEIQKSVDLVLKTSIKNLL